MTPVFLSERLTFDKLFRISEPKRVYRSFTVKGPPLEIDSYQDVVYYIFNFKANPSTTGLRHRGYVKFFKPKNKNPKDVPLQHLECLVDCTCPDFRYRWAWANKQRQSSVVGSQSLNQAWNKAPKKTNPTGAPGLCKHILATRQHIYGLLSSFAGKEPDTAEKLDRLTKYATKRWTDFEGQMRAAKAKEAEIRRRRELRNQGLPVQPAQPQPVRRGPQAVSINAPTRMPAGMQPKSTADFKNIKPEPLPQGLAVPPGQRGRSMPAASPTAAPALAVPPGQRGRGVPTAPAPKAAPALAVPPGQRGRSLPTATAAASPKPKRVIGNRTVTPMKTGAYGWIRPQEAFLCRPLRDLILESVVSLNGESMSTIKEALKIVEELEADEFNQLGSEVPDTGSEFDIDSTGGETLEPSEPPVSDSAIGADTEGETALSLLRSIKVSLEQIAAAVAPVEELPEGPDGAPGAASLVGGEGAEGGEELPMPDEPPTDIPSEEASAEGEAEEEEDEEEEKPKRGEEEE